MLASSIYEASTKSSVLQQPGVVVYAYNPSIWEAKRPGIGVQEHLQLHSVFEKQTTNQSFEVGAICHSKEEARHWRGGSMPCHQDHNWQSLGLNLSNQLG